MGKLQELKDKAKDLVTDNKDKIESGVHKAADFADKKTGHKHTDKIDETAHSVAGKLNDVTHSEIGENEPKTPAPSTPSVSAAVPAARDSAVSPELVPNPSPEATAEGTRTTPTPRASS